MTKQGAPIAVEARETRVSTGRQQLLDWIERDRDDLVRFLQDFVRAKSPNPPGDTRKAAAFVTGFLDQRGLPYRIIAPHPEMPNIVGRFEGGGPGRHLVLNGHIDVFPVADDAAAGRSDPWGGAIVDGKIYGRGVADMKAGTTASIFTYRLSAPAARSELKGKLTLTAVSDEETFGPWGARYLMEHHPEVHGDCLLNGEPGEPLQRPLRREGPALARVHGAHARRARRLHACQQERHQDGDGDRARARGADADRAGAVRQRPRGDRRRPRHHGHAPWAPAPAASSARSRSTSARSAAG